MTATISARAQTTDTTRASVLGASLVIGDEDGRTQRGTYVCKVEADKDGMRTWTSPK